MNIKMKLLAATLAGLSLVSVVGCSKSGNGTATESGTSSIWNDPYYTGDTPTSPLSPSGGSEQATEEATLEPAPEFAEINMTLYVYVANANVRSKTESVLSDAAICGYVKEGDTLKATGESLQWYRVQYNDKTCYIRKSVVCDNALITGFTTVNEEIEISQNVYVRSLPKVIETTGNDLSIRGTLKKGTKVTRTGVGDGWSRIEYTVTISGTDGKETTETRNYYISNECVAASVSTETTTTAGANTESSAS